LPLTYVSGFLIYSSYLGTYNIHFGIGDLPRTKYIYIGFLYLIFLALIAALYRAGMRLCEIWRLFRRRTDGRSFTYSPNESNALETVEKRELAASALLDRNVFPESWARRKLQEYRGNFTVAVLVIVLSIEIIILNPETLWKMLPLQVLYLLCLSVYEISSYLELKEPYCWGLVYGRKYAEDVRWLLFFSQLAAGVALISYALHNGLAQTGRFDFWLIALWRIGWLVGGLAFAMLLVGGISLISSEVRLKALDKGKWFKPGWKIKVGLASKKRSKRLGDDLQMFRSILRVVAENFCRHSTDKHQKTYQALRCGGVAGPWIFLMLIYSNKVFPDIKLLSFAGKLYASDAFRFVMSSLSLILCLFVLGGSGLIPALFRKRAQRLDYAARKERDTRHFLRGRCIAEAVERREKWERMTRLIIMSTILYVTSVLGFGFVIYPHIPAQKSGGNFETVPGLCVRLVNPASLQGCPADLLPKRRPFDALIAIEEDADTIYLAKDQDAGPCPVLADSSYHDARRKWAWAAIKPKYCRPTVYAVSRRCIAATADATPVDSLKGSNNDRCRDVFAPQDEAGQQMDANHNDLIAPATQQINVTIAPSKLANVDE
jgi:hypothetical protein